jgi:hypothetical protein
MESGYRMDCGWNSQSRTVPRNTGTIEVISNLRIGLNVQMLDRLIRELQVTHDANFPDTPLIENRHELLLTDYWKPFRWPFAVSPTGKRAGSNPADFKT